MSAQPNQPTDQNDEQTISHFRGRAPSIRVLSDKKGWMYGVPKLGIYAGALEIDGTNVSIEGALYVNAITVHHRPNDGPFGTIELKTRNNN